MEPLTHDPSEAAPDSGSPKGLTVLGRPSQLPYSGKHWNTPSDNGRYQASDGTVENDMPSQRIRHRNNAGSFRTQSRPRRPRRSDVEERR